MPGTGWPLKGFFFAVGKKKNAVFARFRELLARLAHEKGS